MNRPHKEAIRRALAVLALPGNARTAAAITARTVDAIWHAAGDRSVDFTWYTKRALLTAVYGATVLFWLHDTSDDDADTRAFISRRLHGVGRLLRARGRASSLLGKLRPA
jgi:ubiquinone biosynthesis protein COQ9